MATFEQFQAAERDARRKVLDHAGLDPARVLTTDWEHTDPAHATVTVVDHFEPQVVTHRERVCLPDTPDALHQACPTNHREVRP